MCWCSANADATRMLKFAKSTAGNDSFDFFSLAINHFFKLALIFKGESHW